MQYANYYSVISYGFPKFYVIQHKQFIQTLVHLSYCVGLKLPPVA